MSDNDSVKRITRPLDPLGLFDDRLESESAGLQANARPQMADDLCRWAQAPTDLAQITNLKAHDGRHSQITLIDGG